MLYIVDLVQYQIGPGAVSFYHSGTGLIGCRTVRHSGIYTHAHEHAHKHPHKHTHGHGQAAWTLTWTAWKWA
jgi:hypothetical protein